MQNRPEWMIVYTTHHSIDAQIVAGRLQHEGIPAILDQMTGRDAIGITIGNWGEVRVLVHPENYERAHAILFPEASELGEGDDDNVIYYEDWEGDQDE